MYLTDTQLRARAAAGDFDLYCSDAEHPFDAATQIQPCSIDLRLSNTFWEPVRGRAIDLLKPALVKTSPQDFWKKRTLRGNAFIVLRPGQLLLGRIYERLQMPVDCAGKIEGRSSYSRMGLAVHCTGDFINPGYKGHMPLQLYNFGKRSIKIYPHLPICQLLVLPLPKRPKVPYGDAHQASKYKADSGGPSYWYMDAIVKQLQERFDAGNVSDEIQDQILKRLAPLESDILSAFDRFFLATPVQELGHADAILERFLKSEQRKSRLNQIYRKASYGLVPIALGLSVTAFVGPDATPWTSSLWIVIWSITLAILVHAGIVFWRPARVYLEEIPDENE